MEEYQVENWKKIKVALAEAGKTDCFFYKRAAHISKNGADIPGFDPELINHQSQE